MSRKRIVTILALMLALFAVASLAACRNQADAPTPTPAAATPTPVATPPPATPAPNFNPTGFPIVNEPITLDVLFIVDDRHDINFETNWSITRMQELTNIHVNYDAVGSSDFAMVSNLMFASGNFPDLIMGGRNAPIDIEEFGVIQGILIPIDDLMERYMPNLSGMLMDHHRDMLRQTDGQIYAIPSLQESAITTDPKLYINQRWLNELGLATPTTVTELTAVMHAFNEAFPDGHVLTSRFTDGTTGVTSGMMSFWGVTSHTDFQHDQNGRVTHATQMPGYRESMEWFHYLFVNGLMDPETLTQGASELTAKLEMNNVGLTLRFSQYSGVSNPDFPRDMVPLVPVNAEGFQQQVRRRTTPIFRHTVITNQNQHLPETMRWLDAWFQSHEWMYENKFGPVGVTWDWIDGRMTPISDLTASIEYGLQPQNALFYFPMDVVAELFTFDTNTNAAIYAGQLYEAAGSIEPIAVHGIIQNFAHRYEDEVERWAILRSDINTLVLEYVANFVVNGVTDANWDSFQRNLRSAGLYEFTELAQLSFDRFFE